MEQELCIGEQRILFDREATIDLYLQTITVPGADRCGCIYCKNFAAQRRNVFPAEFLRLLGELGVDPMNEWEAFEYNLMQRIRTNLCCTEDGSYLPEHLSPEQRKGPTRKREASLIGSHHRSRQARCRLVSSYVL